MRRFCEPHIIPPCGKIALSHPWHRMAQVFKFIGGGALAPPRSKESLTQSMSPEKGDGGNAWVVLMDLHRMIQRNHSDAPPPPCAPSQDSAPNGSRIPRQESVGRRTQRVPVPPKQAIAICFPIKILFFFRFQGFGEPPCSVDISPAVFNCGLGFAPFHIWQIVILVFFFIFLGSPNSL